MAGSDVALTPAGTTGLRLAAVMLFLQVAEVFALIEVIFSDRPHSGLDPHFGAIEIYFIIVLASVVMQAIGMFLVKRGRYRVGGAFQIVSSAIHLFKIEGLIGVIGGFRAWNYGREKLVVPA